MVFSINRRQDGDRIVFQGQNTKAVEHADLGSSGSSIQEGNQACLVWATVFDKGGVSPELWASAGLSGGSCEAGAPLAGLDSEPDLNGLHPGNRGPAGTNKHAGTACLKKGNEGSRVKAACASCSCAGCGCAGDYETGAAMLTAATSQAAAAMFSRPSTSLGCANEAGKEDQSSDAVHFVCWLDWNWLRIPNVLIIYPVSSKSTGDGYKL